MDLYTNLPSTKDGSDVSAKASAAKRALMAPMLLRQKLSAKNTSVPLRPSTTSASYTGATGHSTLLAPPHLSRNMEVCEVSSESEDEDDPLQGFEDSHRFAECVDEYDPMLPCSMESILREREAERIARKLELNLQRDLEQLEEDRSRAQLLPPAPNVTAHSSRGGGRGVNNLPAWMRGGDDGVAGGAKHPVQDGTAFVGGGDNAGLGLSSLSDITSAVSVSLPAVAPVRAAPVVTAAPPPDSKALKMMAAWGYKRGEGLGKDSSGITSALEHVKTGSRSGVIVSRGTAQPSSALSSASASASRSDSSSRVVLLCNMAAPGEVDDDLAEEVQDECTQKYGPVQQCFVYECAAGLGLPNEEAVRTFVMFEECNAAESARASLDGRFFGGRKVRASFYDEAKFLRFDLAPDAVPV
jgi:splicing factor 45